MAIAIALLHGLIVYIAAGLTRNKRVTAVVAVIMVIVAIGVGNPAFAIFDLLAISFGYWKAVESISDAKPAVQDRAIAVKPFEEVPTQAKPIAKPVAIAGKGDPGEKKTPAKAAVKREPTTRSVAPDIWEEGDPYARVATLAWEHLDAIGGPLTVTLGPKILGLTGEVTPILDDNALFFYFGGHEFFCYVREESLMMIRFNYRINNPWAGSSSPAPLTRPVAYGWIDGIRTVGYDRFDETDKTFTIRFRRAHEGGLYDSLVDMNAIGEMLSNLRKRIPPEPSLGSCPW